MTVIKELIIALLIIFSIVGYFRYQGGQSEEEVRLFCESIQSDNLSYQEILALAKDHKLEISTHDKQDIIKTKIYKRFGMAYLSCWVNHKNGQIIDIKFNANWEN